MSDLKCSCGRATHTGLGCGPDLPRTPYDRQDELTRLRAENERLREALNRGVALMPVWFAHGWIAEAQAALSGEEPSR